MNSEKATPPSRTSTAFATIGIALVMWIIIFAWEPINFWIMMPLAQGVLMTMAIGFGGWLLGREGITARDVLLGFVSAGVLYGIFVLGDALAAAVLPFAAEQVTDIYGLRNLASPTLIGLLLAFVIGPGEELYWRGYIQRTFSQKWGTSAGIWLTTVIYAGIHIVSGNFMLVAASFVAGLFWAYMYPRVERIAPLVISHLVWDVLVLVLFPIR